MRPAFSATKSLCAMIRDCEEADLAGILDIYNDAVRSTTAICNDTPVDLQNRLAWLKNHKSIGFPVLLAVVDDNVLGYVAIRDWQDWVVYSHTVETLCSANR